MVAAPASAQEAAPRPTERGPPQAQRPTGPGPLSFAVLPSRMTTPADLLLPQVVQAPSPAQQALTPVVRQVAAMRNQPAAVQFVYMRPPERRRE